ncbi:MAG TPA: hypothetical protein VLV86_11680, partial [Vicinamibacterales bacterium]|nr:hypothetical protein [Vicinamibacterales bacterium]
KETLVAMLAAEQRDRAKTSLAAALKDARVIVCALVQFGFTLGSYGVGIWLPQIIKVGRLSNLQIGFVTSGVYAVASASMILWANHVDRGGNKVINLALSCALGGIGLLGAILTHDFWISLAWLTLSLAGINAARGIFFTIPMRFLTGMALAGGIAFINSIGTAGGFVGPSVVGWLTDKTGSFAAGLGFMAAFLVASAALAWSLTLFVGAD